MDNTIKTLIKAMEIFNKQKASEISKTMKVGVKNLRNLQIIKRQKEFSNTNMESTTIEKFIEECVRYLHGVACTVLEFEKTEDYEEQILDIKKAVKETKLIIKYYKNVAKYVTGVPSFKSRDGNEKATYGSSKFRMNSWEERVLRKIKSVEELDEELGKINNVKKKSKMIKLILTSYFGRNNFMRKEEYLIQDTSGYRFSIRVTKHAIVRLETRSLFSLWEKQKQDQFIDSMKKSIEHIILYKTGGIDSIKFKVDASKLGIQDGSDLIIVAKMDIRDKNISLVIKTIYKDFTENIALKYIKDYLTEYEKGDSGIDLLKENPAYIKDIVM